MQLGTNQVSSLILPSKQSSEADFEAERRRAKYRSRRRSRGRKGEKVLFSCCKPPHTHTIAQPHSHLPSTSLEEHLLPSLLHRVRAATERKTA